MAKDRSLRWLLVHGHGGGGGVQFRIPDATTGPGHQSQIRVPFVITDGLDQQPGLFLCGNPDHAGARLTAPGPDGKRRYTRTPPTRWTLHRPEDLTLLSCVFVDDFCNSLGGPPQRPHKRQEQQWVAQANLHGIHGIFPSPEVIHHAGGKDSISMKKLAKGDACWKPEEELLGVLFHGWVGKDRMISLPPSKYQKYRDTLMGALDAPRGIIAFNQFRKLHGQIQYDTSVIPCMKFLMTPLNCHLTRQGEAVGLGKDNPLRRTILRLHLLLDIAQAQPTHILAIVTPDLPH
jgi:hypothetical protein